MARASTPGTSSFSACRPGSLKLTEISRNSRASRNGTFMPGQIQPIPQANNLSGNFSVLIVDEERSSREALRQAAGQLGFMVAAADNFASAMRQLSVHAADLVVLEV